MTFYAFCTLVLIGAAIITWPGPALRWIGSIISGLAIFSMIVLWAVILTPAPVKKMPPIGIAWLEDVK